MEAKSIPYVPKHDRALYPSGNSKEYCNCEKSDKILIGDGRCVDCIEAEKFYEEIMKDVDRFAKNSPHYDPTEMF